MKRWREMGTAMAALALLVYTWLALVPAGFLHSLSNPAHAATLAGIVGLVIMTFALWRPPKDPRFLPLLLAQVLASMPVFYLWAAIRSGHPDAIATELIGLMVFVAWALWAYQRSHRALGLGIIAHGLFWDSWHHLHSDILDPWYPGACLLFDVAVGLVAWVQLTGPRREALPTTADAPPSS
jgi:hypothetical protein